MKLKEGFSLFNHQVSLPVRGAWIEILSNISCVVVTPSLPVRGAWIEIVLRKEAILSDDMVAPRAGSVD